LGFQNNENMDSLPVSATFATRKFLGFMYRTNTCGELRITDINKEVTLSGWVQTVRKFGSITFVDLRDRYGITQLLFNESLNKQLDEQPLGREFVLQASGKVNERSNKNAHIPTGDIELQVSSFRILNKSVTPPFTIQDETDGGDELRGLGDRMRGDRVHSLIFDELEDFRGCEAAAQNFAGRGRMHRRNYGEIDAVLTEGRR